MYTVHQVQLQDAKRGWEELQSFFHSMNTEREKLQAAKQGRWWCAVMLYTHMHNHAQLLYHSLSELQSQLLAVETEMNNKNKEIQTLHSSLTDTMVSKEQVEQKVRQLLEVSQHNLQPDNSLQAQVQVPCTLFFNLMTWKCGGWFLAFVASWQDLMTENKALKVQIESLQHQVTSQVTV